MSHVLVVAAVLAGFGLTAIYAAMFQVTRFQALLALVAVFAFAVPAGLVLLTDPAPGIPWCSLGLSAGLAGAIIAVLLVTRLATRTRPGGVPRVRTLRAVRAGSVQTRR